MSEVNWELPLETKVMQPSASTRRPALTTLQATEGWPKSRSKRERCLCRNTAAKRSLQMPWMPVRGDTAHTDCQPCTDRGGYVTQQQLNGEKELGNGN